jgi:nicotinate-nucleotide pyrophosphorylase (carboxylating)
LFCARYFANEYSTMELNDWIDQVLAEDIGEGDHSTLSCVPKDAQNEAILLVKESGVLAGVEEAQMIFHRFDPDLKLDITISDGAQVSPGDRAFEVSGSARSILTSERLVLNVMQRMSGVATKTNQLAKMIAHTSARLLDTRKTTPGMRSLEKKAVITGGGVNHRHGLYDMIMLKDNHLDYAGGVEAALKSTRAYLNENALDLKIEVEVRDRKELQELLKLELPDRIMLDNFPPTELIWACDLIAGRAETEASGGITEETIVSVAETGVDFISVGALTHSVKSLDLSLKAKSSLV